MKQKKLRSLSAVLLMGGALIFLRCETTEKKHEFVRCILLRRNSPSP